MALDTTIGGISVRINADTTGFQAGLNKVNRKISDASRELRSNANQYGKWAAAGVAAATAVGAAMVRSQMQTIDVLAKTADRLGLTTEALAGLQRSAALSGASAETLNMALQRMTRRVAEAAQGTGEAQGALKELGVDAKALAQLSPDQQFKTLADAMSNVTEQGDRVRLSMKLFDSEGVKLLNTLQMGSEALDEQQQMAEKLGVALNRVDAAKVESANDAMFSAGQALEGIINKVAVELSPIIEEIANSFTDASLEADGFGETIHNAMAAAAKVIGVFADGLRGIHVVFKGLELGANAFRVVWLESMRIMTVGMEQFVNLGIDGLNKIVDAANTLGAGLDPIQGFTFGAAQMFTRLSEEAQADVSRITGELHNLAMQPIPSQNIEEWVSTVKAKSQEAAEAISKATGGGETGGQGMSPEELAAIDARIEKIRESLMTEQQIKAEAYNADLAALDAKRQADLENKAYYDGLEKSLVEKHQGELVKIAEDAAAKEKRIEDQKRAVKMNALSSTFSSLSSLMNSESKKLFEIGKAAAVASAIVDGFAAVQKTMASVPYPFNVPLAAAQAAASAVQVQGIMSTKFGSTGTGQSFSGGQVVNNTATQQQQPEQRNISISVAGGGYGSIDDFARNLIPALNEAAGDGVNYTMGGR